MSTLSLYLERYGDPYLPRHPSRCLDRSLPPERGDLGVHAYGPAEVLPGPEDDAWIGARSDEGPPETLARAVRELEDLLGIDLEIASAPDLPETWDHLPEDRIVLDCAGPVTWVAIDDEDPERIVARYYRGLVPGYADEHYTVEVHSCTIDLPSDEALDEMLASWSCPQVLVDAIRAQGDTYADVMPGSRAAQENVDPAYLMAWALR